MVDKEYIEREALIKQFDERYITAIQQRNLQESEEGEILWRGIQLGTNWGRNTVIDAPAADVVKVKHGTWKLHSNGSGTCDQCHFTQRAVYDQDSWQRFCGVCGARMDNIVC